MICLPWMATQQDMFPIRSSADPAGTRVSFGLPRSGLPCGGVDPGLGTNCATSRLECRSAPARTDQRATLCSQDMQDRAKHPVATLGVPSGTSAGTERFIAGMAGNAVGRTAKRPVLSPSARHPVVRRAPALGSTGRHQRALVKRRISPPPSRASIGAALMRRS